MTAITGTGLTLRLEYKDGLVLIYLTRDGRLNAVNDDFIREFNHALDQAAGDHVRGVVVASSIQRAFCSGVDLGYLQSLSNDDAAEFFASMAELLERLSDFPKPTVAAVAGVAFGAGADLALACDYRIITNSARFRFPGPLFGVVLGTQRLVREVGPSVARSLALTGRTLESAEALDYRLAHELVVDDQLVERSCQVAAAMAEVPGHALQAIKGICNGLDDRCSPIDQTRRSVLTGDFQLRFADYLSKVRRQ